MNIITELTNRIEKTRTINANPCKNYATEAAAEKAAYKMALIVANHHNLEKAADYVVFFNQAWGRWNSAINLSAVVNNPNSCGGYLGLAAQKGFYTY